MKEKLLRIALLMGILGIFFIGERKVTQAADYPTESFPHGIGAQMDSLGYRVLGISYSLDGGVKEYSYDFYQKEKDGAWTYSFTQINDAGRGKDITNINDSSAFITVYNRNDNKHYQVHAKRLWDSMGDFSVITHCYQNGREVSMKKEYSFLNYSLNTGTKSSIMTHNEISLGDFTSEDVSYVYNFYRPRPLNQQTEVALQTGEGKLEQGGIAYYTEDGYYIRELPVASLVKPGYSVRFLGWFDEKEGGKQIQPGTWCASGTTLYARWETTPISYDVTCYDICGEDPSGKVLGEHTWKGDYGLVVSGKILGVDREAGTYYKGYTYQGATTATVTTSGAVLYRFFSEHHYRISFQGNGATSGKMEIIKDCAYTEKISLTKNAFAQELCVTLDGNGENVICKTSELYVRRNFLGWSFTPDGEVRFSDEAVVSRLTDKEEEVTLYAIWSEEKVTVKEVPKRFGYEFAGWAMKPDAQNGSFQFSVAEDCTLYGVWKPGVASYHVEYYKENLEGHYDLVSCYTFEDFVGKAVTVSPEERIYQGFFLDTHSSVLSGIIRPNGSLVLTVFYTRNKNEVSYDLNGGKEIPLPEPVMKKYGEELILWDKTAEKPGYTFAGWSKDSDGKNQIYSSGEKIVMPNHKLVLYAVWIPRKYQVSFDSNTGAGEHNTQSVNYSFDEKIYLPACKEEKTGYEFAGWNTKADGTGRDYSCGEEVVNLCLKEEEGVTLFAQWQPISFEISYDSNISQGMLGEVSGLVENTNYCYTEDSYAARDPFYLAGYRFRGWNTKKDGSGMMFLPGENMKGKISSKDISVLYAIWEPCENIKFQLELIQESTGQSADSLVLYGRTGETVETALKRIYQDTLLGEEAVYFYPGYEVINKEELEKNIQGNHSTKCELFVRERTCSLDYDVYHQGILCSVLREGDFAYRDSVILRDTLEYLGQERTVYRYVDSMGNCYLPGEQISLERNVTMIPQFQIVLHRDRDSQGEKEYVSWGKSYVLPSVEKPGYALKGWYSKEGKLLGTQGEEIAGTENIELYGEWSEPLCYRISYEIQDTVLRILENKVVQYQFLSEVRLPDKNQVVVLLEDYEFAGWYFAEDEEQKRVETIPAGVYGDVVLKAKIVRKSSSDSNNTEQKNPQNSSSDGEQGKQNPEDSNGWNQDNKNQGQPDKSEQGNKNLHSATENRENQGILSQIRNSNQAPQKKAGKVGTVFWKNHMKYQILSSGKGNRRVKIAGNRCRKKQLRIPARVSYQGKNYRVTVIGKKAFHKNQFIKKIVLPSTVISIETKAFSSMKKLSQVTIGKNVKVIGNKVFYKDISLRKIKNTSPKIRKIGKKIFGGCKKLHHLSGLKRKKEYFRR